MPIPTPLLSSLPVLAGEWHPILNGDVTPGNVLVSSKQKAWWLGENCGHSFEAVIRNRVFNGVGCQVCSGRQIQAGFNDLGTTHPTIATEWHPTRNGELTGSQISAGSNKKVWWLGGCGHEWVMSCNSRIGGGQGCPVCAGKQILVGFNDLGTAKPALVGEWDFGKNSLTPQEVTVKSAKKVWWQCDKGHSWEAAVYSRANGNGCPECAGRVVSYGGVRGTVSLAVRNPELVKEWHPTRNGALTSETVAYGSKKRVWWVCGKGHEWEASPGARSKGRGCPICSNKKVLPGFNDLATVHPELVAEWHPTRNGTLKPSQITPKIDRKVWWLGECEHEWEATPGVRLRRGEGCLVCAGKQIRVGFNDLATTYPEVAAEWHPTRNEGLTPHSVTAGSNHKAWWQCGKGHEWDAVIVNRTNLGSGCPVCAAQTFVSKAEQEIADYITSLGFTTRTSVRDIIGKELDIYVPSKNIAVEYNGLYWHSEAAGKTKTYHYDKWKACKEKGIQLIQVWEDDYVRNPGLVKRMLAHKLGVSTQPRLFARKTTVVGLKRGVVEPFLVENHLQGYRTATYYGLVPKGGDIEKPVAIMGVARKGDDGLEIIRFASSQPVVGGFSKLLKHVLALPGFENVVKVYSYSHNDHSDGGVYEKNGFNLVHEGSPGYSYWRNGWPGRQNRLKYSPSRIKNNPNLVYEEGASEKRLAELNGLTRVWDSGSTLWVRQVK